MLEIRSTMIHGDYEGVQRHLAALRAVQLYEDAQHISWWERLAGWLTRRSRCLLDLAAVERGGTIHRQHAVGNQAVPLAHIRGTEGRSKEFDSAFRPRRRHLRARWERLATAWLNGEPLPPVELIQVGPVYYVRDGHHRISVARALGLIDIDAYVTAWELAAPAANEPPVPMRCLSHHAIRQ